MTHSPRKKLWAGALSALLALFAALVVATPAWAALTGSPNVVNLPLNEATSADELDAAFGSGKYDVDYETNTITITSSITLTKAIAFEGTSGSVILTSASGVSISGQTGTDTGTNALIYLDGNISVTLQGGLTVSDKESTANPDRATIGVLSGATLSVTGDAQVKSAGNPAISGNNGDGPCYINVSGNAQVTSSASSCGIYMSAEGECNISGGTVSGGAGVILNGSGDLTVSGGTVESTAADSTALSNIGQANNHFPASAVSVSSNGVYGEDGTVSVTGGTLVMNDGNTTNPPISYSTQLNDGGTSEASRGVIDVEANGNVFTVGGADMPANYLPEDYYQISGKNGDDQDVKGFASTQSQVTQAKNTMTSKLGIANTPGSLVITEYQNGEENEDSEATSVVIKLPNGTLIEVPGISFDDAIAAAEQQMEQAGQIATIYNWVEGDSYNYIGLPVGYGENATDVDAKATTVSTVAMGFQSTVEGANNAINTAMGTSGKTYISSSESNVMWAVLEGTPNTLASAQFTFLNARGEQEVVFANSALPTVTQKDTAPVIGAEPDTDTGIGDGSTIANFVPIAWNGKAVVWFSMTENAGTSSPLNASLAVLPSYDSTHPTVPGGVFYAADAPLPASYTATAWSAGKASTVKPVDSTAVGVNGVDYWYIDPINGKPVAFTGDSAPKYRPTNDQFNTQYAQAGDTILLSTGATVTDPALGTITSWTNGGNVYTINYKYTMPEPSGYDEVPMTAVFGATVTLNLKTDNAVTQFPTGGGVQFVDADGNPWLNSTIASGETLLVGTDANRTLPALPGIQGWNANVYTGTNKSLETAIDKEFPPGTAAAFVGWYSWSATDGYQLWEAGDVVPQYAQLQLYPLFAPVSATWAPGEPVSATQDPEYNYNAWTAPGLTGQYTLSVTADASGLNEVLNVPSDIETSPAAATLLQTLVLDDVNLLVKDLPSGTPANPNPLNGLQDVTFTNNYAVDADGDPSDALKGVTAAYTGGAEGPATFTVYVPAGMKDYGNGTLTVDLPSINTITTTTPGALQTDVTVDVVMVSVNVYPPTAGTVTLKPIESGAQAGMVEITAVPATGYTFDHWSIIGGATPQGVDMNSITIVVPDESGEWVANFVPGDSNTVNVIRMYNPFSGEHLYTSDPNEASTLENDFGWDNENVAWVAPTNSATPIYRLYNPNNGDHLYTVSLNEYNTLQEPSYGWQGEGIKLYSAPTTGEPIYRLFNPYMTANAGAYAHLWTGDYNEYVVLGHEGWQQESVAFYAISVPNPS